MKKDNKQIDSEYIEVNTAKKDNNKLLKVVLASTLVLIFLIIIPK